MKADAKPVRTYEPDPSTAFHKYGRAFLRMLTGQPPARRPRTFTGGTGILPVQNDRRDACPTRALNTTKVVRLIAVFLAFFLAALALYSGGLGADAYYDTKGHILENTHIFAGGRLFDVIDIFPQRPITMITFYVNYLLCGMDPKCFRLVNIAILSATGVMVTVLIHLILGISHPGDPRKSDHKVVSVLAGLFFVIHPISMWATLYIWQRAALLACFFYVASLSVYLAVRSGKLAHRTIGYVLCLVLFEAALFSKENGISLPVVLLLGEASLLRARWSETLTRGVVFAIVAVASIFALSLLEHPHGSRELGNGILDTVTRYYKEAGLSFKQAILTQCRMFFLYLSLIVEPLPSRSQLMIPQTISSSLFWPKATVWACAGIVVLHTVAVCLLRKRPCLAFGILLYSASLLPEAVLVPQYAFFGYRAILPMVGILIIAGDVLFGVLHTFERREGTGRILKGLVAVLGGVYLGLIGAETRGQVEMWRDSTSFWADVVSRFPEDERNVERSPRVQALYNLGLSLLEKNRLTQALEMFTEACRVVPERVECHKAAGFVLYKLGRLAEAETCFRKAVEINPQDLQARKGLERVLERLGSGAGGLEK